MLLVSMALPPLRRASTRSPLLTAHEAPLISCQGCNKGQQDASQADLGSQPSHP